MSFFLHSLFCLFLPSLCFFVWWFLLLIHPSLLFFSAYIFRHDLFVTYSFLSLCLVIAIFIFILFSSFIYLCYYRIHDKLRMLHAFPPSSIALSNGLDTVGSCKIELVICIRAGVLWLTHSMV
jgi:hypothetical protein